MTHDLFLWLKSYFLGDYKVTELRLLSEEVI